MVFDFIWVIPDRLTKLSHVFNDGLLENWFSIDPLVLWVIVLYFRISKVVSISSFSRNCTESRGYYLTSRPETVEEAIFHGVSHVGSDSTKEILPHGLPFTDFD